MPPKGRTILLSSPLSWGYSPDVIDDFVGFDIDDPFVVGYGLDYDGMRRRLPYVAVLAPHARGL